MSAWGYRHCDLWDDVMVMNDLLTLSRRRHVNQIRQQMCEAQVGPDTREIRCCSLCERGHEWEFGFQFCQSVDPVSRYLSGCSVSI